MFTNDDPSKYSRAERVLGDVKTAKARRGKYGWAHTFINWIAQNGHEDPAFTNIGRWEFDEAAEKDSPVYVPWMTIDIDNVDVAEAYEDAVRVVDRLRLLGYDDKRIICSFSGGKGFHVQVDSTQMGLPPFKNRQAACLFMKTFVQHVCPEDFWDPAVLTPRALIRIAGSTHEKTSLRKRAFYADEFVERGLHGVMKNVRGDYEGFEWPEGGDPLPGPRKHFEALSDRSYSKFRGMQRQKSPRTKAGGDGVLNRMKYGVGQGEEFGDKEFHVGRENACFIMGCMFVEHYGPNREGFEKLQKWNGLNDPPLPWSRVKAQWRGAKRKMSSKTRK